MIAKEFVPLLRSLLTDEREYSWLVDFYKEHIEAPYVSFIEKELFEKSKYTIFYPYATEIDNLYVLKSYFTHEKIPPYNTLEILKPLVSKIDSDTKNDNFAWPAQKIQSNLIWHLQNKLSHAIAKYEISLETFVSDNADVILREIISLQILFYIKEKLDILKERQDEDERFLNLNQWVNKEIANAIPRKFDFKFNKNTALNVNEHRKPYDPVIYFFNGATRLPICVQLEYIKALNVVNNFKINVKYFARKNWKMEDLYLNLPLASLRFFLDIGFFALLPYRLLRTLVNEITSSTFKVIRHSVGDFLPHRQGAKFTALGLYYATQAAFYVFLLLNMGLPLLPNPISWIPQGFLYTVPAIKSTYYLSVLMGGFIYKFFSNYNEKTDEPESKNLEWLPFTPHPTEHKPELDLALHDFPKPLQWTKQARNWSPFLPAEPILIDGYEEKQSSRASPAA